MGNFVLSECRNRAYTAEDAALPCIAGEHVRQILPEALVERAALFPPFDPASQVTPLHPHPPHTPAHPCPTLAQIDHMHMLTFNRQIDVQRQIHVHMLTWQ